MKVRVVNFRLTLTPTLSHKWERERFAVRLRFFVGSGLDLAEEIGLERFEPFLVRIGIEKP